MRRSGVAPFPADWDTRLAGRAGRGNGRRSPIVRPMAGRGMYRPFEYFSLYPYVVRSLFEGVPVTTIVILAMVFLFVAFRLWSVLGRRTGHEQTIARSAEAAPAPIGAGRSLPDSPATAAPARSPLVEARAEAGVRAIASADGGFDAAQFLDGARGAYRVFVEASWCGD